LDRITGCVAAAGCVILDSRYQYQVSSIQYRIPASSRDVTSFVPDQAHLLFGGLTLWPGDPLAWIEPDGELSRKAAKAQRQIYHGVTEKRRERFDNVGPAGGTGRVRRCLTFSGGDEEEASLLLSSPQTGPTLPVFSGQYLPENIGNPCPVVCVALYYRVCSAFASSRLCVRHPAPCLPCSLPWALLHPHIPR